MMNRSLGPALSLLLLSGCAATVQTDDAIEAPGASAAASTPVPVTVPTTDASAEASAMPVIPPPGSGGEWSKPNPSGKPNGATCSKPDDCQSGVCEGEGCDAATTKAVCVANDRMCTRDYVSYCGCDGKAFGGSGSCAGRPYKNKGDCK